MRLKEFFYLLGLRPGVRVYGHRIQRIDLPEDGLIEYARWLSPAARDLDLRQAELDELRTFLHEGDLAIDLGAQVGDSTLPIALACGATGTVLAFEPNPLTFAVLAANATLNPTRTHIVPIPYAAAEADEPLVFDYGNPFLDNGGDHTGISRWRHGSAFRIPVQGRRIEPFIRSRYAHLLPRLRYIKTDVECHDLAVLRSIDALIMEFRPFIKAEVNGALTADDRRALHDFLTDRGYSVRRVDGQTLFGRRIGEDEMDDEKTFDVFATPPGWNAAAPRNT
jgi:FkbM family methyltransferase